MDEGTGDGEEHPDLTGQDASAGGGGGIEPLEGKNDGDGGEEVGILPEIFHLVSQNVAHALLRAVSALMPTRLSSEENASRRVSTRQARVPAPRCPRAQGFVPLAGSFLRDILSILSVSRDALETMFVCPQAGM